MSTCTNAHDIFTDLLPAKKVSHWHIYIVSSIGVHFDFVSMLDVDLLVLIFDICSLLYTQFVEAVLGIHADAQVWINK